MKSIYIFQSCLCGALALVFSYFVLIVCPRLGKACGRYARHPEWLGMVVGTICLIWSAHHGALMLEGDLEKFRTLIWCLVPVTVLLSYFYLDYLPARAIGGFLTLSANFMITSAFAYDVPGRGFYGIVCLALGIVGMVGIGIPWRYRDLLVACTERRCVRRAVAAISVLAGIVLLAMPWFARM